MFVSLIQRWLDVFAEEVLDPDTATFARFGLLIFFTSCGYKIAVDEGLHVGPPKKDTPAELYKGNSTVLLPVP